MKLKTGKWDISKWVLIFIPAFFVIYTESKRLREKETHKVVVSDAMFYHEYIAVHIFGQEPYVPREQKPVIKYSMGMAFTYMPAIGVGYVINEIRGLDHNHGKNMVYQRSLFYLGIFYAWFGLFFLRLILKRWFDSLIVAIVLAALFWGTNLYFYVWVEPLMAHAASFFMVTAFVHYTLCFFDKPAFRYSIPMAFFLGFITLIRPTNILLVLFPLVYWLAGTGTMREKWKFVIHHFLHIILLGAGIFIFFIPQMVYWHHYTGTWFYYSYGNEHFFWSKPALLQVLFSFRKGWFIYTPLMFFSVIGAFFCYKNNRRLFWSMLVFSLVNVYVISCWWCWWYGGSFGMRPMIDTYGLFAIWIAYLFQTIYSWSRIGFGILILVTGFLVYMNLFQTRQARLCRIHYDSMSYGAYKKVFLSNHFNFSREEWDALLDPPNYDAAQKGERFW